MHFSRKGRGGRRRAGLSANRETKWCLFPGGGRATLCHLGDRTFSGWEEKRRGATLTKTAEDRTGVLARPFCNHHPKGKKVYYVRVEEMLHQGQFDGKG